MPPISKCFLLLDDSFSSSYTFSKPHRINTPSATLCFIFEILISAGYSHPLSNPPTHILTPLQHSLNNSHSRNILLPVWVHLMIVSLTISTRIGCVANSHSQIIATVPMPFHPLVDLIPSWANASLSP